MKTPPPTSTSRRRPASGEATGGDPRKREQILQAATTLFSRYGYRHTSIELLAQEAGVAKPTLYAHFTDKDDIFRAVCRHVLEGILTRAAEALSRKGNLQERLSAALGAKFVALFELVHRSPHATELLDSQSRLCADIVTSYDRRYRQQLEQALEAALPRTWTGPSLKGVVDLLLCAGHGAGYKVETAEAYQRNLRQLVRLLLTGLNLGDGP
ncbi:MAG TPA: TetR/AcrR family transcriptional regulator [Polyangia bacterium]|jgi:AcrR family transcriptional regulator|nr:TetR/AcrR family transcriptional regulator [Polyangia bacterium]